MVRATGRTASGGVAVVGAVAVLYGIVVILGGLGSLGLAGSSLAALVLGLGQLLGGLLLLPAGVGLIQGKRWGQLLGIVGFFGVPAVQVAPVVAGMRSTAPLLGIVVAASCGIYLTLASEEFDGSGGPSVPDDEGSDGPSKNPLR